MATKAYQQRLQQEAINNLIVDQSLRQYVRMECVTTPGPAWAYKINQPAVTFQLHSADRSVLGIRLIFRQIPLTVTLNTGTAGLNLNPLASLLGQLKLALGNTIYEIPASLLPLIMRTFQSYGRTYHDPGEIGAIANYSYSSDLYGSVNGTTVSQSLQSAAGTNVWSGWLDIPMAWLLPVKDSLGVAPTLSGSPLTLFFSTPQILSDSDPFDAPFYVTGDATVTLGTNAAGNTGFIEAFIYTMTGLTPSGSSPTTPDGVVGTPSFGAGIEIRQAVRNLVPGSSLKDYFVPFQEGTGQKELLKSLIIIDNPGEVNGLPAKNEEITRADLMYDRDKVAVSWSDENNPQYAGYIENFFINQRLMYGDLPPGVLVYDFLAGTDARYPNNFDAHFNLAQKPNAGVRLSYTGTLNTGAKIRVINMYGRTSLYTATV